MARLRPAAAVLVTAAAGGLGTLAARAASVRRSLPRHAPASPSSSSTARSAAAPSSRCAPDGGGRTADRLLKDTGHALTYVQRFPAFVCRIDGVPADDPCVNTPPADAYWGLWWSDGESGEWSYSSLGRGLAHDPGRRLRRDGLGRLLGRRTPADRRAGAPDADAHPHPDQEALADPGPDPEPVAAATPTATPRDEPTSRADPATHPDQEAQAVEDALALRGDDAPEPTTEPSSDEPSDQQTAAAGPLDDPVEPSAAADDGGLPAWVAPVVVVVLLGAAGGVAVVRRRQQP